MNGRITLPVSMLSAVRWHWVQPVASKSLAPADVRSGSFVTGTACHRSKLTTASNSAGSTSGAPSEGAVLHSAFEGAQSSCDSRGLVRPISRAKATATWLATVGSLACQPKRPSSRVAPSVCGRLWSLHSRLARGSDFAAAGGTLPETSVSHASWPFRPLAGFVARDALQLGCWHQLQ